MTFLLCGRERAPIYWSLDSLRGPVCEIFNKCQFVGKRQKIKGRAIKRFSFGSKSWWKDLGSVLPYRQNCAISPDKIFVTYESQVSQEQVTYVYYFFSQNIFWTFFCSRRLIFLVTHHKHATSVYVRFWHKKNAKITILEG